MSYKISDSKYIRNGFWNRLINNSNAKIKDNYYLITLRSNLAMDPVLVSPLVQNLFFKLKKINLNELSINSPSQHITTSTAGIKDKIHELTKSLSSEWYRDRVLISFSFNRSDIYIEPIADGVDISISVSGENAKETYRKLNQLLS